MDSGYAEAICAKLIDEVHGTRCDLPFMHEGECKSEDTSNG